MSLILVLALGWGVFELVGLRRYRKRREREAMELLHAGEKAAAGAARLRQAGLTEPPGRPADQGSAGGSGIERA